MDGLCALGAEDDEVMMEKIRLFIHDRTIDTVTGVRRMGRSNLVNLFLDICKEEGIEASLYPKVPKKGIVVFSNWIENVASMDSIRDNTDLDVIYGQDLCHQVPAMVRWNRR